MRMHLTENARKVLEARYLRRDSQGQIIETPEDLFRRVAHNIAKAEERFDNSKAAGQWEEAFREALVRLDFLPNSPTLMNAGTALGQRNATCTSVAPTGTISILANTAASIEPLFALAYRRQHVLGERTLVELNPLFLQHARQQGFYSERLMQELQSRGSLADIPDVPASAKALFRAALEIAPEDHLRMQAAFQKHVDNAVSKTINLPRAATAEDIATIYRHAWEWGLKGITVFRYGSKGQQVLELGEGETVEEREHAAQCDPYACKL
jgi:ribonucleotide reductase alpha subunit